MIYIICGLPGTGKTTLCRRLEQEAGFQYVSDWQIFSKAGVEYDRFLDKEEVSARYSSLLIDFLREHLEENLAVDFEYSLSPKVFMESGLGEGIEIAYLGFVGISEEDLAKKFTKSGEKSEKQSLEKAKLLKEMSKKMYAECKKLGLNFIDVSFDRDWIINRMFEIVVKKK